MRGVLRGNVGICEPQGGEAGGLIHPRRLLPGAHLLPCAASAKGRFACYYRGCRCCRGRGERVRGAYRAGNNSRDPARANGAGSSSVSLAPFLLFLAPSCPLSPRGQSEEIEILHLWRSVAHKNHRKSASSPALLILIVAACIHNSNTAHSSHHINFRPSRGRSTAPRARSTRHNQGCTKFLLPHTSMSQGNDSRKESIR